MSLPPTRSRTLYPVCRLIAAAQLVLAFVAAGPLASWAADPQACFYCGMQQREFRHSWMQLRYGEEAPVGFCSLHCASIHMALNRSRLPDQVLASDHLHRNLIDADTAVWVIGGDLPGVMTTRAKWAFAAGADAEAFVAGHGGSVVDFDRALEAAFADMYQDIQMIQDRRAEQRSRRAPGP